MNSKDSRKALNKKVSANIQKVVDDWQKTGKIGTSRPKTKAQAVKQAIPVAYSKAGASKSRSKTK